MCPSSSSFDLDTNDLLPLIWWHFIPLWISKAKFRKHLPCWHGNILLLWCIIECRIHEALVALTWRHLISCNICEAKLTTSHMQSWHGVISLLGGCHVKSHVWKLRRGTLIHTLSIVTLSSFFLNYFKWPCFGAYHHNNRDFFCFYYNTPKFSAFIRA